VSTVLILDCPYLAHRAESVAGGLSHDGEPTSVVFALLRDLVAWQDRFRSDAVAFCFDSGKNKRLAFYPEYKRNRTKDATKEHRMKRVLVRYQLYRLMEEDLYKIGFRNVFWEDGYEADDVIASVALFSLEKGDEAIIVGSDSDLWQLISPTVSIFDPRMGKQRTLQWFSREYGLSPSQWADVKAIAGCPGDNIIGVDDVGEKSAVAFLAGRMSNEHRRYKAIIEHNDLWRRNLRLVRLPFEGCPRFDLRRDDVTKEKWRRFCRRYGMRSLAGAFPGVGTWPRGK